MLLQHWFIINSSSLRRRRILLVFKLRALYSVAGFIMHKSISFSYAVPCLFQSMSGGGRTQSFCNEATCNAISMFTIYKVYIHRFLLTQSPSCRTNICSVVCRALRFDLVCIQNMKLVYGALHAGRHRFISRLQA